MLPAAVALDQAPLLNGADRLTSPAPRSDPKAVEHALLEHPAVQQAWLVDEQTPDGRVYRVAYVVPHDPYVAAARSRVYQTNRDRRLAQWRMAFDQNYRVGGENNAPSFVGWNSSYANTTIPESEMRDWLNRTVERITALRPERVLEIGCGVGLLVRALAPKCRSYHGADFSPVAIGRLRQFIATRPDLGHVELFEREASDLDNQPEGSVDTVVLNSVVQYFPHLDYLQTVLERASRLVRSGGYIFVGDLRSLGLQSVFHGSVQIAKAPPEASVGALKRKVALAIDQEKELVIDPQFFHELSQSIPRIVGAEIMLKRGATNNELTRYRYDVVLQVGEPGPLEESQHIDAWSIGGATVAEILPRFAAQRLAAVRILDIPNRRLAGDLAAVQRLASADDRLSVKDLSGLATEVGATGLDPEDFWALSDGRAHDIRVAWSPDAADGRFDVVLTDRSRWAGPGQRPRSADGQRIPASTDLATDPLVTVVRQQLGVELAQMLRDRLPEAAMPMAVLVVSALQPTARSQGGR
jgi:ubiquinone/menaquinone biosynthesis C-methylase UbiE